MVLEEIAGPFSGYYVAAYAVPVRERTGEYIAYFKICSSPPASYWEADCLLKDCCAVPAPAPSAALAAAQEQAHLRIAALPRPSDLQAHVEKRPFNFYELRYVASLVRAG